MSVTRGLGLTYCRQPVLNGTGGGLLAARSFLENVDSDGVLITMGDVPFVREATYRNLLHGLEDHAFVILGFRPEKKKRYGVLDIQKSCVRKIIEWKYWRAFPEKKQKALPVCNSGIYAAKRETLLRYLSILAKRPHKVQKEIDGEQKVVEEFFITDLVEYMNDDGLKIGHIIADDEEEVMGVDDLSALKRAQTIFRKRAETVIP